MFDFVIKSNLYVINSNILLQLFHCVVPSLLLTNTALPETVYYRRFGNMTA